MKFNEAEFMQTRSLRSLLKIAKVGSFVQAADQMNMTLSALSMQMKALETELQVVLFDRSVRPPRLTPIGRSVVEKAALLLHQEDALTMLCRPSDTLAGQFRLGFVMTAAVRLLPQFLERARAFAPDASFAFETGLSRSLENRVLSGQIDAAVITDAGDLQDGIEAQVLREEPFVYAAHNSLLADDLQGLFRSATFFHFMPQTGIGKQIARHMEEHAHATAARTIVLDNLEAIMECVSGGLGYTLLPVPDVERYRSEAVNTIPLPAQLRRVLVLATLKDGTLGRHRSKLAQMLGGASLDGSSRRDGV
ncbi:MAG: LysR family transcriptional regulator [Pseudomonadota bacterium]